MNEDEQTFTDLVGNTVKVGDTVAYGVRDGNTGKTKAGAVVSIQPEPGYQPKVGVRVFAASPWGSQISGRVSYPNPEKMVKVADRG